MIYVKNCRIVFFVDFLYIISDCLRGRVRDYLENEFSVDDEMCATSIFIQPRPNLLYPRIMPEMPEVGGPICHHREHVGKGDSNIGIGAHCPWWTEPSASSSDIERLEPDMTPPTSALPRHPFHEVASDQ